MPMPGRHATEECHAELGRMAFAPDKDFSVRQTVAGLSESEVTAMRVGLITGGHPRKAGDQSGSDASG